MVPASFWGRLWELSGNYIDLFHKWVSSKLDFYTNWLKGKLLNCQARAFHGFYKLPWFIFPREKAEQESFLPLLRNYWRITHQSIRARRIIHSNSLKNLIEYLNTKCAFLISYYQAYDVVLLNQLNFSGLYYECPFQVSLGIIEIQNIPTYKTKPS